MTRQYELCKIQQISKVGEWNERELREDYNVSRSYHEGFFEWYIKRKAPDSVRQILAHAILLFSIYLWTNFVLCMILIGIGSVACIVLELYEWVRDIRIAYQKKLKKAGE